MHESYFLAVPKRAPTAHELALLRRLLQGQDAVFREQLDRLCVVGRCGCGKCPTIFFRPHAPGFAEADLVSLVGVDEQGGLVGVVLMHDDDTLTQMEFYSVDGHAPWSAPTPEGLKPFG